MTSQQQSSPQHSRCNCNLPAKFLLTIHFPENITKGLVCESHAKAAQNFAKISDVKMEVESVN